MAIIDRRGVSVDATDPAVASDPNPGLAIKAPVRAATAGANITLSGLQTVDTVALADGDRVLVKDQTDARTNGIYVAQSGLWQRSIDAENNSQWADGTQVLVTSGSQADSSWALSADDPVVLGTSDMGFVAVSVPGTRAVNAVAPLTVNGGASATLATDLTLSTSLAAQRLAGNPNGITGTLAAIALGATLAFSASTLQTAPFTGDVTTATNSFVTTIASNAVTYGKLATAAQGLTNVRLAKSANYTAVNADKGCTIALTGAFTTQTLNAASGYDANYSVRYLNESTSRGQKISPNGITSFILWPGQTCLVFAQNNVWKIAEKSRWKLTGSVTLNVDPATGSDANDGLATGAGAALATIAQAVELIAEEQWDMAAQAAPQVKVQLADGTHTGGTHYPGVLVGGAGHATLLIAGNHTTPSNVIVAGDGAGGAPLAFFDCARAELQDFKIQDTAASVGLSVDSDASVRLLGGMIFGNLAAGAAQMQVQNGGTLYCDGDFSVDGYPATGNGYMMSLFEGGSIYMQGRTCNILANLSYLNTVLAQRGTRLNAGGSTWNLNAHTVTTSAGRYSITESARIFTFGAGGTLIPGSSGGSVTSFSGDFTVDIDNAATIASGAVTYAKMQNVTAARLLGNPSGGAAAPSEITLGATLAFSGSALQTAAQTGDVTTSANSFATTVAKIQGVSVYGSSGNIGLGTESSPQSPLVVSANATAGLTAFTGTIIGLCAATGTNTALTLLAYAANNITTVLRANGTPGSPTALANGDIINNIGAGGYNGSAFTSGNRARILIYATSSGSNWTTGDNGTEIAFETIKNGTTTRSEVMRVLNGGNIKLSNAASWTANGATAASLGSTSPGNATPQEWLTVVDSAGTTRYIPAF